MNRLLTCLIVLSLNWACQYTAQPPDSDCAVYESVINQFSYCNDNQLLHRHGQQLLIRRTTAVPRRHQFDFSFAHAQQALAVQLQTGDPFYREPGWAAFLSSVDNAQFTERLIDGPLNPACRGTVLWTDQQIDRHFMHGADGYHTLGKAIKNFGGIVTLSAVVYAADKRKAICYYECIWGYKEGYGKLVFLENRQSVWHVVGVAGLWIA
ncbi:hypothetical protein [Spirosoma rhododendri]|uniref:Uncharacterized protein n=1 Tax=Spirosoma rhododendri TaxID=2728024 RepID=A0A7L5DFX6_9BACT|nr:hypothetical protein [Spirosoma rhododendri]QJD77094.1 hypothetical protein HH216_00680 [Spirosoma rhododendri]